MMARIIADALVVLHLGFIAFVVAGGLLVLRRPRLAWLHLPAALWGIAIELFGFVCPLTPLENAMRIAAGQEGYPGGFIERYVLPVVYPAGLTRTSQLVLALVVLAVNAWVYGILVARRSSGSQPPRTPDP